MPTVKIGRSRQVVIPKTIHDELGLKPGDFLEVERRGTKVIFSPKQLIDRELALALEDFKKGRVYGPFSTAEEMIRSLHNNAKRIAKKSPARR